MFALEEKKKTRLTEFSKEWFIAKHLLLPFLTPIFKIENLVQQYLQKEKKREKIAKGP